MALLDVNVLVALAWDTHVHHVAARRWFAAHSARGWATCPITQSGFVRVSSNPKVLPTAISVADARRVLAMMCAAPAHDFLTDTVSLLDEDVPTVASCRQLTDAHLLTLARRHGQPLVTFDSAIAKIDGGAGVLVLSP